MKGEIDMKKCQQCGKAIPDNFPNCPSCGAPVEPVKDDEPAPVVYPTYEGQPTNTVDFYKHVKKFKGIHVFFLYFFKLLYVLGVIAMLGAVVVVPFIPEVPGTTMELFSMDFKFEGLTSILTIVRTNVQLFLDNTEDFAPLVNIIGVLPMVLLLLPAVIWAVIKLIRCVIMLFFSFAKKKAVVVECLAKAQKREYDFGLLNIDKLYFYGLIATILVFGFCILNPLLESLVDAETFESIHGFTKCLDIFSANPYMNFGSVCVVGGIAVASIFGLLFIIVRGIVKRKVKKHFGLLKKKK